MMNSDTWIYLASLNSDHCAINGARCENSQRQLETQTHDTRQSRTKNAESMTMGVVWSYDTHPNNSKHRSIVHDYDNPQGYGMKLELLWLLVNFFRYWYGRYWYY